jgi:uncharacterized protein YbjT (DUF2867 family)
VERVLADIDADHGDRSNELGGPRVYTYRSLLEVIARSLGKEPLLVPVRFDLWRMFALVTEMFPQPPITQNQVSYSSRALSSSTAPWNWT